MKFDEFIMLADSEARWHGIGKLPWDDPAFSERMLREHLSQLHDGASRRIVLIEHHVAWMHGEVLESKPQRILDLGCGPGLYTQRLASLGHTCVGIDISPASIAYARAHAGDAAGRLRYVHGDFTTTPIDEPFDFAMLIHGEFNTLTRKQAGDLLKRIAEAIGPHGRVLLEVHPLDAVEAIGRRPRAWSGLSSGLFGDRPHLRMDESKWDAGLAQAVNVHWVVDGEALSVDRFGTVTHGYSTDDYVRLLTAAGFSGTSNTLHSQEVRGTQTTPCLWRPPEPAAHHRRIVFVRRRGGWRV
jgi:SAM-dependent methyltransferase